MSYYGIKNTVLFVLLTYILFSASFFCHFFSMGMGEYSQMNQIFIKSVSFISTNGSPCCASQGSTRVFFDQILATKVTNQILIIESVLSFIFLLGVALDLNFLDSQNSSRYRYYSRRSLLSRIYNYILQFFSQGILQPKIYNA